MIDVASMVVNDCIKTRPTGPMSRAVVILVIHMSDKNDIDDKYDKKCF